MDPEIRNILLVALFAPLIGFVMTYILEPLLGAENIFLGVIRFALAITVVYTLLKGGPPSLTDEYFISFLLVMLVVFIVAKLWLD